MAIKPEEQLLIVNYRIGQGERLEDIEQDFDLLAGCDLARRHMEPVGN